MWYFSEREKNQKHCRAMKKTRVNEAISVEAKASSKRGVSEVISVF